jgi:hypothetical protein
MKNNFQWISESRSQVHNVKTLMNGLKSQAFKKHNGIESTMIQFKGMSEADYRRINN